MFQNLIYSCDVYTQKHTRSRWKGIKRCPKKTPIPLWQFTPHSCSQLGNQIPMKSWMYTKYNAMTVICEDERKEIGAVPVVAAVAWWSWLPKRWTLIILWSWILGMVPALDKSQGQNQKPLVPESGELGSVSFGPLTAMAHGPFLKHLPWHGMLWVGRAYFKKCFLVRIIYGRVIWSKRGCLVSPGYLVSFLATNQQQFFKAAFPVKNLFSDWHLYKHSRNITLSFSLNYVLYIFTPLTFLLTLLKARLRSFLSFQ